jgi:hypothetical protein
MFGIGIVILVNKRLLGRSSGIAREVEDDNSVVEMTSCD